MKKAGKAFSLLLASVMLSVSALPANVYAGRRTAQATFSSIGMTINGESFDMRPIIDGVSYFPVRTIGYALNCRTEWIADTKSIILTSVGEKVGYDSFEQGDGTATAIFEDSISITADGKLVEVPVPIINDRSYVPIKAVAEAMGKRATWDGDTRTIQIVNPQTVKVDDDIKDYYVYDLPEIKSQEDYLVGNWKGTLDWWATFDFEYFIRKNTDGTYTVTYKQTIREDTKNYREYIGNYAVAECKAIFDKETSKLTVYGEGAKHLHTETPFAGTTSDCVFVLSGDVLYMPFDENVKNKSDFKSGKLTRF